MAVAGDREARRTPLLVARLAGVAQSPRALPAFATASALETWAVPVPIDLIAAPILLARHHGVWALALWGAAGSWLAAMPVYLLATALMASVGAPVLAFWGLGEAFAEAAETLGGAGVAGILILSVMPVPFGVPALAAGLVGVDLSVFLLGALTGRLIRFILVLWVVKVLGHGALRLCGERSDTLVAVLVILSVKAALVLPLVTVLLAR